jgi:hypothetical protein
MITFTGRILGEDVVEPGAGDLLFSMNPVESVSSMEEKAWMECPGELEYTEKEDVNTEGCVGW